jgi:hypothetical protein
MSPAHVAVPSSVERIVLLSANRILIFAEFGYNPQHKTRSKDNKLSSQRVRYYIDNTKLNRIINVQIRITRIELVFSDLQYITLTFS